MIKERYEISITDKDNKTATGYLAPLRFLVADLALGFTMLPIPKYLSAGEVLINTLWVKGSPRLRKGGDLFNEACLKASSALREIDAEKDGDILKVYRMEPRTNAKKVTTFERVCYKCDVSGKISRDVLELALGYTQPNQGNPRILEAGRLILKDCWVSGDSEIGVKSEKGFVFGEDEEMLIALCHLAYQKMDFAQGELKKV